jgi:hypothetical protein
MDTKTVIIAVAFAATIGHNVAESYLSNYGSKYNVESFYIHPDSVEGRWEPEPQLSVKYDYFQSGSTATHTSYTGTTA